MKRDEALAILKLDKAVTPLTPEIVQQAFRRQMMENHPDTTQAAMDAPDKSPMGTTFQPSVYQAARKTLLDQLTGDDSACKLCGGLGMVQSKMGYRACVACSGSGDKK